MLDRQKAVLVVVDFQEKLLPTIPVTDAILPQAIKLIRFARKFDIPILWTEQYPRGLGSTVPEIATELEGLTPIEKTSFGCMGDVGFERALENTGRKQLLLTGVETHVCMMQTALAAVEQGYEVYVPRDAVASQEKRQYKAGLRRMEQAGVVLGTTQMILFELLREAGTPEFKQALPLLK
jgi:nicotinamidase-related amidase